MRNRRSLHRSWSFQKHKKMPRLLQINLQVRKWQSDRSYNIQTNITPNDSRCKVQCAIFCELIKGCLRIVTTWSSSCFLPKRKLTENIKSFEMFDRFFEEFKNSFLRTKNCWKNCAYAQRLWCQLTRHTSSDLSTQTAIQINTIRHKQINKAFPNRKKVKTSFNDILLPPFGPLSTVNRSSTVHSSHSSKSAFIQTRAIYIYCAPNEMRTLMDFFYRFVWVFFKRDPRPTQTISISCENDKFPIVLDVTNARSACCIHHMSVFFIYVFFFNLFFFAATLFFCPVSLLLSFPTIFQINEFNFI